jgi:hypothetical protein
MTGEAGPPRGLLLGGHNDDERGALAGSERLAKLMQQEVG